jgi:DNA-binding MarR family transcriptional regulator
VDVLRLNRLARQLREVALKASQSGEELPVSMGDLAVLESVARNPGSTISEISRSTGLAQSRISKVVQELTEHGVFECSKDPNDRRQTRVRLHPAAHQQTFEDYGRRPVDAALAEAFPSLGRAEVARATELLSELTDLLDRDAAT